MKYHVGTWDSKAAQKVPFPPFVIIIFQITVCDSGNDLGKKLLS